jgi:TetR/AcrR family transcriptional repressor of nem operon
MRAVPRPKQFDPHAAVDKATALFWRKGYASTTPQDLSDELGIGKGSLYNTFESKRGLFGLALRRYGDARLAGLADLLQRPAPVKERLRRALLTLAAGRGDPPLRGCLAVNTAIELGETDPEANKAVRAIFDRMESLLVSVVEEGRRLGEIDRSRDPAQVASLLFNAIVGLQVLGRASDSPARLRRIIDAVIATL